MQSNAFGLDQALVISEVLPPPMARLPPSAYSYVPPGTASRNTAPHVELPSLPTWPRNDGPEYVAVEGFEAPKSEHDALAAPSLRPALYGPIANDSTSVSSFHDAYPSRSPQSGDFRRLPGRLGQYKASLSEGIGIERRESFGPDMTLGANAVSFLSATAAIPVHHPAHHVSDNSFRIHDEHCGPVLTVSHPPPTSSPHHFATGTYQSYQFGTSRASGVAMGPSISSGAPAILESTQTDWRLTLEKHGWILL